MAEYDLPALFEYVLAKTGVESVTYIGHSQGTMQMFAALSERSHYFRPKINLAIMLAPVTRIDNMSVQLLHKLKNFNTGIAMMESLGPELFANPGAESYLSGTVLSITGIGDLGLWQFCDKDPNLCSEKARDTFLGHFPSGISFRSALHFRQILLSKQFQKYDYGFEGNFKHYGQETPPAYDLSRI
jgi:lysosomal acid lipase/cholesteryl ester hydrolase